MALTREESHSGIGKKNDLSTRTRETETDRYRHTGMHLCGKSRQRKRQLTLVGALQNNL